MKKRALSKRAGHALASLEKILKEARGVVIAYSGGMDSGFLSLAAKKFCGKNMKAFFAVSELIPQSEIMFAKKMAGKCEFPLRIFELSVLHLPVFQNNPPDRCYHCKKHIFTEFIGKLPKGWILCDGSNLDDHSDYRPGHKALRELGVESPLDKAGFSKKLIREVLAYWGYPEFDRPAQACLATRVATGSRVCRDVLHQIEAGEKILRDAGFPGGRFRHHGMMARIEVPRKDLKKAISALEKFIPDFKALGFKNVVLDLEGYKQGSMNQKI